MSRRLTVPLFALLTLVVVPGCVYYNTFYHATTAAREAEIMRQSRPPGSAPSPAEMELLDRVVEKCGRVIKLHPDSEWADDALVLMGEALYRQSKYETAQERFNDFVTLYPDSELRPRAEYFLAGVLLAKGNAVSAEELLTEVAFADPPSELSDDALLLIGDARRKRNRFAQAAEAYQELLDRFPRSDRRAEVRFVAAENFVDMGRLEDAAGQLDAVARERSSRELAFESRLRLAGVLVDLGDTGRALEVLGELERRTTARDDVDRILLMRGRTYEAMGDFDGATATYSQVAFEHERSDAAGEAHYRIGLIERDHRRDFDRAIASFREVREQAPRSDVATLASAAVADIETLRGYLSVIAGALSDSTDSARPDSTAPDSAAVSPPDSAAPGTTAVSPADSTAPDTTAVSRLDWSALDFTVVSAFDSTAADSGLISPGDSTAVESTGGSPADSVVVDAVVGSPADSTAALDATAEIALARFRVAELYLFKLESPTDALAYYGSVIEEHPTSELAPKAAYAIGWIKEHKTNDLTGALEAYRDLIERFPETEHAAEAGAAIARIESAGAPPALSEGDAGGVELDASEEQSEPPPASD